MVESRRRAPQAFPNLGRFSASDKSSTAWIIATGAELAWRIRALLGESEYEYRVMSQASVKRMRSGCPPSLLVVAYGPGESPDERLVSHLSTRWPTAPLVIVSSERDDQLVARSLHAGADDWITSDSPGQLVTARLAAIRRRSEREGQETRVELGDLTLDRLSRRICRNGEPLAITTREFALLDALARGNGFPVTRRDLMAWVWDAGTAETLTENALEVYVSYLRRKLQSKRVEILTVRGVGYRLVVHAPSPARG